MECTICAVVVTYNPDIAVFKEVMNRLQDQVDNIVVVDNFSKNILKIKEIIKKTDINLIDLPKNTGIAYAQNKGIAYAQEQLAEYVMLMDQDTVLPRGAVASLLQECSGLEKSGLKVAAVGHAYRNMHDNRLSSIWVAEGLKLKRRPFVPALGALIEADFIIASGSLIPLSTINDIGGMEEDLFIDLVDVEWGLRARSRGYKNYQSYSHIMVHTLGNSRPKVLWRNVTFHSPIRNYYSLRNSLLLIKRPYIGWAWRLHYLKRILPYFVVCGLFPDQRRLRIKLMLQGLLDGLQNRSGPYLG